MIVLESFSEVTADLWDKSGNEELAQTYMIIEYE